MDDQSRIALVRVGQPFPNDPTPAVKYHLGDHLGSSNLVLDASGALVNREEYTPYGETSFGSFARKRYRFTGKERDEESGLNYHGARYIAPWIGRWTSCDPAGVVDGLNLYRYARNNPLVFTDPHGTESDANETTKGVESAVVVRDELVNGVHYLEFANPEDISSEGTKDNLAATPGPDHNKTVPTEKTGSSITSKYQGDDPSKAPSKANSTINRDGFKDGSREWTTFDDLATFGAILGRDWDPDKIPVGSGSGGIPGGKVGNKPSPVAQVLYFAIQLINLIGLGRVAGMAKMGVRSTKSATAALFKLLKVGPKPKVVYSYGGDFSITPLGWQGYPASRAKPSGPFNFLDDGQYQTNRALANDANEQIRDAAGLRGVWSEVHEVQPVRFGGHPTDLKNKELLWTPDHWEVSAYWINMQRWITGR